MCHCVVKDKMIPAYDNNAHNCKNTLFPWTNIPKKKLINPLLSIQYDGNYFCFTHGGLVWIHWNRTT